MKLRQYTVTISDGGEPHKIDIEATSALAALAQIVQAALSRGTTSPVLVLDGDRLRELHGLELGRPRNE